VPVTVKVYVPRETVDGTLTVSVEELVAGFGLNVPDAPGGRPLTVRLTGELKPPIGMIVMV
jgi:hypothetical protein